MKSGDGVNDFPGFRQFPQSRSEGLPIIAAKTDCHKKCRLTAVVRMSRIKKILRYFLALNDQQIGAGKLHADPLSTTADALPGCVMRRI
jgi:hypothetical protein